MTPNGQRPIKGFRPGKEPPRLKKQRAKQRFGQVSPMQERLIELFAERTPDEARALMRRWRIGLLTASIALAVAAGLLYLWSLVAAIVAGSLAIAPLVLWWRLHRKRGDLEAMADAVSGGPKGRRRRG